MGNAQIEAVLAPYYQRVTLRRGNGLSRSMNQTLRSYPRILEIIQRSAESLIRAEMTLGYSGVKVRPIHLYWDLVKAHDDWGVDVPVIEKPNASQVIATVVELREGEMEGIDPADHYAFAGTVKFLRRPTLPYNQFAAAMTIAKRIRLFTGHGRIGLDLGVLSLIKAAVLADQNAHPAAS